jgi:hypothetical protein
VITVFVDQEEDSYIVDWNRFAHKEIRMQRVHLMTRRVLIFELEFSVLIVVTRDVSFSP